MLWRLEFSSYGDLGGVLPWGSKYKNTLYPDLRSWLTLDGSRFIIKPNCLAQPTSTPNSRSPADVKCPTPKMNLNPAKPSRQKFYTPSGRHLERALKELQSRRQEAIKKQTKLQKARFSVEVTKGQEAWVDKDRSAAFVDISGKNLTAERFLSLITIGLGAFLEFKS